MISLAEIIRSSAAPADRLRAMCLWLRCTNENYLNTQFTFDDTFQAVFADETKRSASLCRSGLIRTNADARPFSDPLLYRSLRETRDRTLVVQQLSLFNRNLSEVQRALLVARFFTGRRELTRAMVESRYGLSRRRADREYTNARSIIIQTWHLDGRPENSPPSEEKRKEKTLCGTITSTSAAV
jgi:hypothetical protein